jgi:hypothetical protein
MIVYTVKCEFDDPAVAEAWERWLRDEHAADVCGAGALDAEVVRLDGAPSRLECRYHFASRETFAAYERDHAPRLRAEGMARVPACGGVRFERTLGTLVASERRRLSP